ncbi:hypothetical protein ACV2IT_09115 [Salmonella enterica subsp. enterica serovar Glostrup]|uniref:hypothetical protein n=1 Tax=Salmonella enterica TaxID=28901 RepID=UPI0035938E44
MKTFTVLLKNLLLLIAGIGGIAAFFVHAASFSSCQGLGNTTFQMQNLNFKAGSLPSPGQVLYTTPPYTISYECSTEFASYYKYAPTLQKLGDFQRAVQVLSNAGLGMNIIMHEQGKSPVTWTWDSLQWQNTISFGAPMSPDSDNIARTATFQIQLIVARGISSAQIVQVPSLSAFSIIPSPSHTGAPSVKINSTPFAIRYMPDNFGYVSVSPSLLSIGHVYTDYPAGAKRASFTVTAGQRTGVGGPSGTFTLPLNIAFTVRGKSLTDTSQAIVLTTDNGQPNGLKLSILDGETGNRLTFGTPGLMGTLVSGATGTLPAPIRKTYTALLEQIPGQPLVTGPFSADVVATVTYD